MVLLGTWHRYHEPHPDRTICARDTGRQFERRLVALCNEHGIRGLGEEMSWERIHAIDLAESTASRTGRALSISHRMCDPDTNERCLLGVGVEYDERPIEDRMRERVIREGEWLRRLRRLEADPLLFACGAGHVATFGYRLVLEGFEVSVADSCWTPPLLTARADVS